MLDKERIANTPSKEKNDEWLEGFGIDISLLRLTDELPGAENSHPNITPSKSDGKVQPSPERIPHAKSSKDTTASAPLPLEGCITPKARRTRRYTDIFEEARSGVVHPGLSCSRAVSVRKHRRASVRVSSREMRGIMDGKVDGGEDMRNRTTGTEVCLTPVRASRKQREELGADIVVTPVRRSLRLTRRRESDLPTSAILEAHNFAFAPNRNL